jgi:site-specific DNA recombinase
VPVITKLEAQVANATNQANQRLLEAPSQRDIKAFAEKAKKTLQDLKFEPKRAIILNTVEKVVSDKNQLQVTGYLPLTTSNYVGFKTDNRYCWPT